MRRTIKAVGWAVVLLCSLAVCAQAVALWRATRIENMTFTRYFDPARAEREASDQGEGLADLFADTGLEDNTGAIETVPNRFMLGLLPAGPGRHAISVLTLAGPGAVIAAISVVGLLSSFRRSSPSADRGAAPARTP